MQTLEECLLMYRHRLRRLLAKVGVASNPAVDDGWILDRLEEALENPLAGITHVIEYSPNCPSPYLVRLVGRGQGVIDKLPTASVDPGKFPFTKDALGYGQTFREAATNVLQNYGANKREEPHEGDLLLKHRDQLRVVLAAMGVSSGPCFEDKWLLKKFLEVVNGAPENSPAWVCHLHNCATPYAAHLRAGSREVLAYGQSIAEAFAEAFRKKEQYG